MFQRLADSTFHAFRSPVRLFLGMWQCGCGSLCSGVLETGKPYSKTQNLCLITGHPWTSKIGQSYVLGDITAKFFPAQKTYLRRFMSPGSEHTSRTHTNSTTQTRRLISPPGSAQASRMGSRSSRKLGARNGARSLMKRIALCERDTRNTERSGPRSSRTPFSKNRNAGQRIYETGSGTHSQICTKLRGISLGRCRRRRGSSILYPPLALRPMIKYPQFVSLDRPGGRGQTQMKGCSGGGRRAFLRVRPTRTMKLQETRWRVISWMYDRMGPGREEHPSLCPCPSGMW